MFESLQKELIAAETIGEKLLILQKISEANSVLKKYSVEELEHQLIILQIKAIGQEERLFQGYENRERFRALLDQLVSVDRFYREMGGIVGYQTEILKLLQGGSEERFIGAQFHSPRFLDISKPGKELEEAIQWGLEAIPQMAEIYPLGGAADRLNLIEEETGKELPAAKLPFAGRPLLEQLIRDLEAREHLYFERFGVQVTTPIAIMTSEEKNNDFHVKQLCEKYGYFGRSKDSIRFFTQPLVPTVDRLGQWCIAGPLTPVLKPGGHGVIWKLAKDEGIFDWFESLGRKKCLIRQINNPIAGLDYGLLAFTGIGSKKEMVFGFASAPRLLKSAEGVNVLIEKGEQIVLSNIEYCDFEKHGIQDAPLIEGEPYSRFSSNTNILFADLKRLTDAVRVCPFPGLLINLKKGTYTLETGARKVEEMARLESTMQNIADVFVEPKQEKLETEKTFVTYNLRHKTISTAKKGYVPGRAILETPESCLYDLMLAHRELLRECGFDLPKAREIQTYLSEGPEFLFLYHPSLGPLYSDIRQKIQGGRLEMSAEWILEVAHARVRNLNLQGSLQIYAEKPLGQTDSSGKLQFSKHSGRVILENVIIENRGVSWKASIPYWKMGLKREEEVKIILKGDSEFIARNVHLKGTHTFIVEEGQVLEI